MWIVYSSARSGEGTHVLCRPVRVLRPEVGQRLHSEDVSIESIKNQGNSLVLDHLPRALAKDLGVSVRRSRGLTGNMVVRSATKQIWYGSAAADKFPTLYEVSPPRIPSSTSLVSSQRQCV
jgi:hypothetical protein